MNFTHLSGENMFMILNGQMSFKWTLDIDWTINIIVVVHENPKYILYSQLLYQNALSQCETKRIEHVYVKFCPLFSAPGWILSHFVCNEIIFILLPHQGVHNWCCICHE